MKELPSDFIKMLHDLMGDEASALIESLDESPVVSVRINRRKPVADFPEAERIAWCESGFYLKHRPEFIFDPLLHAGAYYVQDASSMIYETVAGKILGLFSESKGSVPTLKVLDLCAAPGGKTTAMINALPDGSLITANEYTPKRVGALRENIERWGYENVNITNRDSSFFAENEEESYDIVAVDAPCSGEGMMRKEEAARMQWSEKLIDQCSSLQKEILINGEKALKPGGFLIYSTCTFNRKENEENAEFLKNVLQLQPVDLNFPEEWGIMKGFGTELPVYRFMPHKTRGEGLFLSVFRKPGEWEPSRMKTPFKQPEIKENHPEVEVDKKTALTYLRGESIILPPDSPLGFVTITYKGLPLGQAKNIGKRANNLYPKNRRILKRL